VHPAGPTLIELQAIDRAGNIGKAARFTLPLDGVPPSALEFYPSIKEPFVPLIQRHQENDVARFKAAAASPDARAVLDLLSPLPGPPVMEVPGLSLKAVFDAAFKRDVLSHDRAFFLNALLTGLANPVPVTFPLNIRDGKVEPGLTQQEMQSLLQFLREVEPLATVGSVTYRRWDFKTTRAAEIKLNLKSSDAQLQGHEILETWVPGIPSVTKYKIEQQSHYLLAQLEKSRTSILYRDFTAYFGKPQASIYHNLTGFSWPERGTELVPYGSLNFRFRDSSDEISETTFDGNLSAFSVGELQKPLNALQTRLKLSPEDARKTRVSGRIEPDGKVALSLTLPDKSYHRFNGALNSDQIEVVPLPPAST
jgi:hypothetical protein